MKAANAAAMACNVACNTGRIPQGYKCMVLIEPTSICNLKCPLCPTGTGVLVRQNKYIPTELFTKIVQITEPVAEGYVLNLFGEPTFHPNFDKILELTASKPTWLSSNLSFAPGAAHEMARWKHLRVICSIDTPNPDEYTDYRIGGEWEKVMQNLDILVAGKCTAHPQFLVSGDYDKAAIIRFAKEHGIQASDVIIKEKLDDIILLPTSKKIPGRCHSPYVEVFFNCDGYLVPCCNNVTADLHMGNISEMHSHHDIFSSMRGARIRRILGKDKNAFACCGNCSGLNYWHKYPAQYLNALKGKLFSSKDDGFQKLSFS